MSDKQKITLYISDTLHRQFKIRSAVDGETMSSMAQRAIAFYLENADLVETGAEVHGNAHQLYSCPQCSAAVALREGELALVHHHGRHASGDEAQIETLSSISQSLGSVSGGGADLERSGDSSVDSKSPDEGELITC